MVSWYHWLDQNHWATGPAWHLTCDMRWLSDSDDHWPGSDHGVIICIMSCETGYLSGLSRNSVLTSGQLDSISVIMRSEPCPHKGVCPLSRWWNAAIFTGDDTWLQSLSIIPGVVSVSPADLSALFSVLLDPLHWHCTVVHSVYSVQVCASLGPLSRPAIASVWLGPELSPAPALPGSTVPGPPAHQEHSNLRCDFKINVKQTGGHHVF